MGLEDKIAIVGAGCRFPGTENLDEFWEVLINGENHVKEIPATRWNNSAFYDEDQNAPGKIYSDREMNDIEPRRVLGEVEACRIDPQQRYVLECVHMALKDGGITRKQINGTNTGVIIGSMNDEDKVMANSDLTELGGYTTTGTASSVLAARISYVYNLHGTCLTLDTACSSALIAIHLASQAIQTGNSDMMICGVLGSAKSPDPGKERMFSLTEQRSPLYGTTEDCYRAKRCSVIILKSLKAAIEDGNKICATMKMGQDCPFTNPVRAPSVLKNALTNGNETLDTSRSGIDKDESMAKHVQAPSNDMRVELLKNTADSLGESSIKCIESACPLPTHIPLYPFNGRGVLFFHDETMMETLDQFNCNQRIVKTYSAFPESSSEMYLNSRFTLVFYANLVSKGMFVPGSNDSNSAMLFATGRPIFDIDDIYLEMKYIKLLLHGSNDHFVSCSDVTALQTTSIISNRIAPLPKDTVKTWLPSLGNFVHVISISFNNNDNDNNLFVPYIIAHENTIFIVRTDGLTDSIATNKMFDTSIQMFYNLKALLTALKASTIAFQVAVITENTQRCPGRTTITDYGAELWGMIRSAAREAGYTRLVLIDVDRNNNDTDLLLWLLVNANEDAHEFVLSGSTVYQPTYDSDQPGVTYKLVIFITESGKMALLSYRPRGITEDHLRMPCITHSLLNALQVNLGYPISNNIYLTCGINRCHLVRLHAGDFQITDGIEGNDNSELDVMCMFPVTTDLTNGIRIVHVANCCPALFSYTNDKQLQEFALLAHEACVTSCGCCDQLNRSQRTLLNLLREAYGPVHGKDGNNDWPRSCLLLVVKKDNVSIQRINELVKVLPRSISIMLPKALFSNVPFENQITSVSQSNSLVSEVNLPLKDSMLSVVILYRKNHVGLTDNKGTAYDREDTFSDPTEVTDGSDNVIVTFGNLTKGVTTDNNRYDVDLTETGTSYCITIVTPAYKDTRVQKSITYKENTGRQISDGVHRNDKTVLINGKFKREIEIPKKDVVLSGRFDKQTSRGWDHKVDVSLAFIDGRVVLEWGKERRFRKNRSKALELRKVKDIDLRDLNGIPSLIIKAKRRTLVFKTPDRIQANIWLEALKGTKRTSLKK